MTPGRALRALLILIGLLMAPVPALGQTLSSGMLGGVVQAPDGTALPNARVVVEEDVTGIVRAQRTDREGRFQFRLLAPGTYSVLAERLGYQPQRVTGVPLAATRLVELTLALAPAEPPVMTIDTVAFMGAAAGWSQAGSSRWLGELELDAPRARDGDVSLLLLASSVGEEGSVEGLPASLSRVAPNGMPFSPLGGPLLDRASPFWSPRGLEAIGHAQLAAGIADVQWGGSAGAQLLSFGRRGTREFSARAWGLGADPTLPLGPFSDPIGGAFDIGRGGIEVSGPIVRDTAVFLIGAQWRTSARIHPRAWSIDELAAGTIGGTARDSAGLSLRALGLPWVEERDEISAWGRFDWLIAENHDLGVFFDLTTSPSPDAQSPLFATPSTANTGDRFDLVAGGSLRSILSPRFSNEVRAGVVRSTRDELLPGEHDVRTFRTTGIPFTSVLDGALLFGADNAAPFTLERTAFYLEQALLLALGSHTLKLGVVGEIESREHVSAFARAGAFTFGDAEGFASRTGSFVQSVGAPPIASWSTLEAGAFLQDAWRPAPGLEIVGGIRFTSERLPVDDVEANTAWRALTGISSDSTDARHTQFSPRLALQWDIRNRGRWLVSAGIGRYHDDIGTDVVADWLTHQGGVRMRRGFGPLGTWPLPPDSTAAPVRGALLTLLSPGFRAPRSTRASLGISRVGTTSLHLSGTYRHTDFLPARRDLNRHAAASAFDQYGRPLFGTLRQEGALVGAAPGSNRRFPDFDVVSALESTAWSDYWDATVLLERRLGEHLRFAASYTFSRTRDNWLFDGYGSSALAPQLTEATTAEPWAEGTSDFDVPHRVAVVAEATLPLAVAPTLTVTYRGSSGLPYTPGFRDGVDVNGDYASNDPAFVDDQLPGMPELLERQECLRDQVGGFAERNSCRAEMRHALDVRLGFRIGARDGRNARVFFDAINLLENEIGFVDDALYLVDPTRSLEAAADGTVTVPLVVNPDFGEPLRSLGTSRIFRIGLEVGL